MKRKKRESDKILEKKVVHITNLCHSLTDAQPLFKQQSLPYSQLPLVYNTEHGILCLVSSGQQSWLFSLPVSHAPTCWQSMGKLSSP